MSYVKIQWKIPLIKKEFKLSFDELEIEEEDWNNLDKEQQEAFVSDYLYLNVPNYIVVDNLEIISDE